MATLGLKTKAAPQPPKPLKPERPAVEETPVFKPERLAAQVGSDSGQTCFVQGKHLFTLKGAYVGVAPEHQWYFPSEQEEINNARTKAKQRQFFNKVPERSGATALPQKVLNAARENAQALAAEENAA